MKDKEPQPERYGWWEAGQLGWRIAHIVEKSGKPTTHEVLGGIAEAIEELAVNGQWSPAYEEIMADLAGRFDTINAERYIQGVERLLRHDNRADIGTYTNLVATSYEKYGRKVGTEFADNYSWMVELGIDPEDHLDYAESATQKGGKTFAASFLRQLPELIGTRHDPQQMLTLSATIRTATTVRLADRYLRYQSKNIRPSEYSHEEFAGHIINGATVLDNEIMYWGLPGMIYMDRAIGYPPERYIADIKSIKEQFGKTPSKWYAYGLKSLGENMLARRNELDKEPKDEPDEHVIFERKLEEIRASPEKFAEHFTRIVQTLGKTAAIFYARTYNPYHVEAMHTQLNDAKKRLSKKVFREALWFLPQIATYRHKGRATMYATHIPQLLKQLMILYETYGADTASQALYYTNGINRRSRVAQDNLFLPNENRYDSHQEQWDYFNGEDSYGEDSTMPF